MAGDEEIYLSLSSLSEGRISLSDDGQVATHPHHRQQIDEEVASALQCCLQGDPNVGSSSSSAIKKRKKRSKVWDEMREYRDADGNVKAECKHCEKTFDGSSKKGTTRLWNHLRRCPANPKRKSGSDGLDGDDQDQSLFVVLE